LGGLSRQTVMAIARDKGVALAEADIDLYDAYAAEEAFITSTSWCMVPVRTFNGRLVGAGTVPGPVTARLIAGYRERLGGFDFVAQYTKRLEGAN
jgi:branched-chain amino acid aminotransferase